MNAGEQSPQSIETRFGNVVRRHRQAMSLSQEALADQCDLHRTYISQLERGLKSPSLRSLQLIAGAFGLQASTLLREAEQL